MVRIDATARQCSPRCRRPFRGAVSIRALGRPRPSTLSRTHNVVRVPRSGKKHRRPFERNVADPGAELSAPTVGSRRSPAGANQSGKRILNPIRAMARATIPDPECNLRERTKRCCRQPQKRYSDFCRDESGALPRATLRSSRNSAIAPTSRWMGSAAPDTAQLKSGE